MPLVNRISGDNCNMTCSTQQRIEKITLFRAFDEQFVLKYTIRASTFFEYAYRFNSNCFKKLVKHSAIFMFRLNCVLIVDFNGDLIETYLV